MSRGRPLATEAPFGYTFENSEDAASSSTYAPPGPPLLDNNESGFLDSFFNNPDNVDPSILSFPDNYQGDAGGMFGSTSFDWASQSALEIPGAGPINQPNVRGSLSSGGDHGPVSATADVYAAAGILHNQNGNTARQQGSTPYAGFPSYGGGPGADGSQMNGYTYPAPTGSGNYGFNGAANGFYQDVPARYAAGGTTNAYAAGLQNRLSGWSSNSNNNGNASNSRPELSLNFGSDDNFRQSIYAAPPTEAPDKQLAEAVSHNFRRGGRNADTVGSGHSTSDASAKKRRRRSAQAADIEASSDEYDSMDGDDPRQKRRRRSKVKEEDDDDDEDDDYDGRSRRDRNGRRKHTSTPTKSRSSKSMRESPSKKHRASTSTAKAPKENLSEEQKRSNHIQSEQKRRNLIKQGFDDLNRMVPELRQGGLSKSNTLVEAARFMRRLRDENDELRAEMESLDNG